MKNYNIVNPGTFLVQLIEVIRPVQDGELVEGTPISNKRGNKFWTKMGGIEQVSCFDGITDEQFLKLQELGRQAKDIFSL